MSIIRPSSCATVGNPRRDGNRIARCNVDFIFPEKEREASLLHERDLLVGMLVHGAASANLELDLDCSHELPVRDQPPHDARFSNLPLAHRLIGRVQNAHRLSVA